MIILVCGGRNFYNEPFLRQTLDEIYRCRGPIVGLIHGDAQGADRLAAKWMNDRIKQRPHHTMWCRAYHADWRRYGPAAGPIRNQRMINENPGIGLVVAFHGGSGTADCVRRARAKGLEVIEVDDNFPLDGNLDP